MAILLQTDLSAMGAVGNNATDDAAALQAAINAAPAGGVWVLPPATYRVGSPLIVNKVCHLIARQVTLRYTGAAGPAAVSFDTTVRGGMVEGLQVYKDPQDWNTSLIGILCRNLMEWRFEQIGAAQFPVGIQLLGDGAGCAYNALEMRAIRDNKVGLQVLHANGGYVTENRINGGNWYYLAGGAPATHVQIVGGGVSVPDNLRFNQCSFQAVDGQVTALDMQVGRNCGALFCRFETINQQPLPVKFAPGTFGCHLVEPYPPQYLVQDQGSQNYTLLRGMKQ